MPGDNEQDLSGHIGASYPQPECPRVGEKAGDSYRRHPAAQDRGTNADLMSWNIWSLKEIGDWDFAEMLPRLVQPLDCSHFLLFYVNSGGTARGNLEHIKSYSRE